MPGPTSTKTGEDRRIELCPRALQVVNRQLVLRDALVRAGKIRHDHLFFKRTGEPVRNLQYAHSRWRRTLARLPGIRKPYCARHSSVSWNLMIGRSALWVAKQHGHSIATMLRVYAAWTEGAIEADLEAIEHAMTVRPATSPNWQLRGLPCRPTHRLRRAPARLQDGCRHGGKLLG